MTSWDVSGMFPQSRQTVNKTAKIILKGLQVGCVRTLSVVHQTTAWFLTLNWKTAVHRTLRVLKGVPHTVMLLPNCSLMLWELSPSLPVAILGQFYGLKLCSPWQKFLPGVCWLTSDRSPSLLTVKESQISGLKLSGGPGAPLAPQKPGEGGQWLCGPRVDYNFCTRITLLHRGVKRQTGTCQHLTSLQAAHSMSGYSWSWTIPPCLSYGHIHEALLKVCKTPSCQVKGSFLLNLASPHPAVPSTVLLWLAVVHFHSSTALLSHLLPFSSSAAYPFEVSSHLETETPAWH